MIEEDSDDEDVRGGRGGSFPFRGRRNNRRMDERPSMRGRGGYRGCRGGGGARGGMMSSSSSSD